MSKPASNPLQQTPQAQPKPGNRQSQSSGGNSSPDPRQPQPSTSQSPAGAGSALPTDDLPPFGESQEHLVPGESPLPPVEPHGTDEENIRAAAYDLYTRDGYIEGRHMEHWLAAERDLKNPR